MEDVGCKTNVLLNKKEVHVDVYMHVHFHLCTCI